MNAQTRTPWLLQTPNGADLGFAFGLLQQLVVPTFVLGADGRVLIWNRACERLTGLAADEVLGTKLHWQAFYDAPRPCLSDLVLQGRLDQVDGLYASHAPTANPGEGVRAENWCIMPRLQRKLYLAIDAGPIQGPDGAVIAVVETLRDLTNERRATDELVRLASHDALTGLNNRRAFDVFLEQEWSRARREAAPLAMLMVDVDHFKRYNDTFGHPRGDDCLRQVADVLAGSIYRSADQVARIGGEEFAVLLPATPLAGALKVAERIRLNLGQRGLLHPASEHQMVTVSMGAAGGRPGPGINAPATLMALADEALYAAKRAGRNCCHAAPDPSMA